MSGKTQWKKWKSRVELVEKRVENSSENKVQLTHTASLDMGLWLSNSTPFLSLLVYSLSYILKFTVIEE